MTDYLTSCIKDQSVHIRGYISLRKVLDLDKGLYSNEVGRSR